MPPSPAHASIPDSKHSNSNAPNAPSPASGTPRTSRSGSRQTRRLKLRSAGFRGPAITSREATSPLQQPFVSPPMASASTTRPQQSSDAENISPAGRRAGERLAGSDSVTDTRNVSGGILQDIGNSATFRQSKRARQGTSEEKSWAADSSKHDSMLSDDRINLSPQMSSPGLGPRSVRVRTRVSKRPGRSISAETRRYVDHLEAQLSEAQAQLSAMTSPTVTREHSSRMRHMNAETRQLQEELAAWEEKYEDRVREELDKHFQLEETLRSRMRHLEQEAGEAKFKSEEFESQWRAAMQNLEAVETANVNLEKRIEIMSELLASSPNKIDLHAEAPGRMRSGRPKSMLLPRFPTAGSLAVSPERYTHMQATSPRLMHRSSASVPISPVNVTYSPDVASSEDEDAANSDASLGRSSVLHMHSNAKTKPMRRMRRFGAGSIGPKLLILPSTSHCEQIPASAPPLERDEYPLPFSRRLTIDVTHERLKSTHRRTSSEAGLRPTVRSSPSSPLMNFESSIEEEMEWQSLPEFASPPSRLSLTTTNNMSSLGSRLGASTGRNLMEELTAVRAAGTDSGSEDQDDTQVGERHGLMPHSSPFNSDVADDRPTSLPTLQIHHEPPCEVLGSRFVSGASTAIALSTAVGTIRQPDPPPLLRLHSCASSRSLGAHSHCSASTFESLRSIFSGLFRSPVELAKHLIQTAQNRMHIPRPLLTVQWWLVGVLLGPMARRRILGRCSPCSRTKDKDKSPSDQRSLLDSSVPPNESLEPVQIAYGAAYQTPQSSSTSSLRSRGIGIGTGTGKAKASSSSAESQALIPLGSDRCPHHARRWKHSPLLWLKFSMTLAIAVGVAFKDGPSSLLQDAVCGQCCKLQTARQLSGANWRKANRADELLVTPGSRA